MVCNQVLLNVNYRISESSTALEMSNQPQKYINAKVHCSICSVATAKYSGELSGSTLGVELDVRGEEISHSFERMSAGVEYTLDAGPRGTCSKSVRAGAPSGMKRPGQKGMYAQSATTRGAKSSTKR